MTVLQLFMAALLMAGIPVIVGSLFLQKTDRDMRGLVFQWVSGQVFLWACFQLICVPMILLEIDYYIVADIYSAVLALAVLAAVIRLAGNRKAAFAVSRIRGSDRKRAAGHYILWAVFWALLAFQLVQAVRMTYGDGDDAFFVAITSVTQDAQTMYRKLPYTGWSTELDARHGLAPFPIWITYLADVAGIRAVSMAHVVVPVALIAMAYGVFYLLGRILLEEKKDGLPLFLIFTELLVLFGDYSFYTVENFMIARSRQGKAALGSIVIPVILFLLLILLRRLQKGEKMPLKYYVLLAAANITGCLCSTLGAMLCCMLVGILGLWAAAAWKRWKILIPLALCCLPAVCYAVMYLALE
ncbi:MAG: DUF6077 domain-containing protein [Eubacterium sp.]|nr:DUF6077 domain-containing protein [Eubacterium sp.]MCM1215870.1 DUF6077 domain-containing protein [Lachnospiraceae bacterium]MCM1304041.1 DUF6077 domain-containing protein [Butyrivibrio sp.]MCM1343529.1 DUF6077 domain-containing protein [Muribaculaceae bacterium]MCM1239250.1 DUF6077 domain-containing protein [Lachnospiraceae bacterium]